MHIRSAMLLVTFASSAFIALALLPNTVQAMAPNPMHIRGGPTQVGLPPVPFIDYDEYDDEEDEEDPPYSRRTFQEDDEDDDEIDSADANVNLAEEPLEARLRRAPKSSKVEAMGCVGFPPSASVFRELNLVCEDCFRLFRDQEIYHMCRSDCFGSDFFLGCMDYLIYDRRKVRGIAGLVRNVHSFLKKKK